MITPPPRAARARPAPRRRPRRSCARRAAARAAPRAVVLDDRLGLRRGRSRAAARSPRACRRGGPPRAARSSMRSVATSSGRSKKRTASSRRPISASIASSASACGEVAREAVEDEAARARPSCASRSRISSIVSSSGTSAPAREDRLDLLAELGALRRSRRGTCRRSRCAESRSRPRSAWPAFPCRRPAGRARAGSLAQEPFVGAHHHLRLHLAHRVERDADDDQHRGAAERARGRLREVEVVDEDRRAARRRSRGRASPGSVSRVSTRSRYCAVGGPGRMPGM